MSGSRGPKSARRVAPSTDPSEGTRHGVQFAINTLLAMIRRSCNSAVEQRSGASMYIHPSEPWGAISLIREVANLLRSGGIIVSTDDQASPRWAIDDRTVAARHCTPIQV